MHITGTVEPIPTVTLQSIFYPTDYPDKKNPQVGLVKSQQLELATTAAGFKKYLEYDPDAKLSVEAYADMRGSKPYNQDLSERRVERIKQYLVDQGVAADKVETAAYGKDRPMPQDQVEQLEGMNPQMPPPKRFKTKTAKHNDWLAYNRRADIVLQPSGQEVDAVLPAWRRRFRNHLAGAETAAQEGAGRRIIPFISQRKSAPERNLSGALLFLTTPRANYKPWFTPGSLLPPVIPRGYE